MGGTNRVARDNAMATFIPGYSNRASRVSLIFMTGPRERLATFFGTSRDTEREAARSPGTAWDALVAIVVWVVASALFGLHIANFASYDKTYGSIAGVITFLLWL